MFCKAVPNKLLDIYESLPYFVTKLSLENALIIVNLLFNVYVKDFTLQDGTVLSTKEDWDDFINNFLNEIKIPIPLRMPQISSEMYSMNKHITNVQTVLNIKLGEVIIQQLKIVEGIND